jgi:Carboxypeptidase regulatory-like domain
MRRTLGWSILSMLLFAGLCHAQAVGTIVGTVTDPSGAVVPSAKVTVTQEGTGFTRTVNTNASGYYVVPSLNPGAYSLGAVASGFQKYSQKGITLQANESATVNVALKVGATTQTVTVEAGAALVNTTTSTLNEVVDQRRMVDLPLNGRNAAALTLLVGGVVNSNDNGGADQGSQKTFPGAMTVSTNGSRQNTINFQLDGANYNDEYTNVNQPFPFPDAVQEFSVQTSNYTARYGENSGGQVNVVTKSGTNQLHGDGFEFVRNAVFNARNFTEKKRDQLKRNQFGGTVGGPIVIPGVYNGKDKSFFFFGYQGTRLRNVPGGKSAQVPTDAEINGDFSALLDPNSPDNPFPGKVTQIIDPTTGLPFANNMIDPATYDQAALGVLNYLPRAKGTGQIFFLGAGLNQNFNEFDGRLDHAISNKDQLTGRFTYNKFSNAGYLIPQNILTYSDFSGIKNQNYLIHETHIFRPNMINDFRVSYSRELSQRGPPSNAPNVTDFGVMNVYQPMPKAIESIDVSGFFSFGSNPQGKFIRNDYDFEDDVSLIHGSHHITFGGTFDRSMVDIRNQFLSAGDYTFTNDVTNFAIASFLLGNLRTYRQGFGEYKENRDNFIGIYLQDDYHATRRLTLNWGVRYEPAWPWREKRNRVELFRPEDAYNGVKSQIYINAPPGVFFVGDAGVSPRGTTGDFNNVAPRVGFAYDVFGDGKTSLRGGAGVFYDSRMVGIFNNRFVDVTPFSPQLTVTPPQGPFSNPTLGLGNPFPAPFPPPMDAAFPTPLLVISYDPHQGLRVPTTYQWNMTLEHQFSGNWLLRAGYVGSRTNYINAGLELNPAQYIPGSSLTTDQRRPLASVGLGNAVINDFDINSGYNSLQITGQKRFSQGGPSLLRGVTLLANYTYARSLDDLPYGGGVTGAGGDGGTSALPYGAPYRHRMDYGRSTFDRTQVFVASYVWQLPALQGSNAFARGLFGNWAVTGILTAESGDPLTVIAGKDQSQTGLGNDRGVLLGSPMGGNACVKKAPCVNFLNPLSFGLPAIGTAGNVGKGFISGPGLTTWDMGFFKNIPLGSERYRLQLRGEFFNIFNRPNFNDPTNSVSSGSFGQILGAGDPRIGQLALKIFF